MFFKKKEDKKKIAKIRGKKILLLTSAILLCLSYAIDVDAYEWIDMKYDGMAVKANLFFNTDACSLIDIWEAYANHNISWGNNTIGISEKTGTWVCSSLGTYDDIYADQDYLHIDTSDNVFYDSANQKLTIEFLATPWAPSTQFTIPKSVFDKTIKGWPPASLWQTGGIVIEQPVPEVYNDMVDEAWISVDNDDCLYANPNTKKYSKPSRFCRMDNFNLAGEEGDYNFFCPNGSKFYWFGQYNKINYRFALYMGVCAHGNNKTSITNIDKTFSLLSYPYWALWYHTGVNNTTSLYWIRFNTTATGITLETNGAFWPDYLNQAYSAGGWFTWSITEYFQWPIFTNQSTLLKQYWSTTVQNDVGRNFNYIMNNLYIDNCNTVYCPFAGKFETVVQKLIEFGTGKALINTAWSGTNLPSATQNTEIDTDIFTCDRDGDGDTSIVEGTICPFTIIGNIWSKTIGVLDSFMNLMKELLKLWNTDTERMFYNPFSVGKANANSIVDAFGQQGQTTLYEGDGFFHNIFSYLYWGAFTILFMTVVTILLIKRK